jgi:hypothetical protein
LGAGIDYFYVIWKWDRLVALAIIFVTFCMARVRCNVTGNDM